MHGYGKNYNYQYSTDTNSMLLLGENNTLFHDRFMEGISHFFTAKVRDLNTVVSAAQS